MAIKLKNICRFQSGGTPSRANELYFNGTIPWISTVALNGRTIDSNYAAEWITEKAIAESAAKIVPERSVMLGTRVGIGKVAINSEPMATSQDIVSLVEIDESVWDKAYICKFLQSKEAYLKSQARGATIKGIKINTVAELDVPAIPRIEQKRIVTLLNATLDIIENRKNQLTALDDLVKARFVEMFGDLRVNPKGWRMQTFDELTELITDGEHATPRRVNHGIYLLSARNILNHCLQLNDVDYIDQEEYSRIAKRVIPREGDILISCSGSVGRCCSVPADMKLQMVRSVALLRFKSSINPVFAEYMITSDFLQEQINSSKTASSQANLFQGKIARLRGFAPPKELQEAFLLFVQQVDKSKSVIQKSLVETQTLFDSLMQQYFG